jgi:hypothetical protein
MRDGLDERDFAKASADKIIDGEHVTPSRVYTDVFLLRCHRLWFGDSCLAHVDGERILGVA